MAAIKKLTKRSLEALKSKETRVNYFDGSLPGFCVRVSPSGTKTFALMYRIGKRQRFHTIGRYPAVSLTEARQNAQDALYVVSGGEDPQAIKKANREAETFAELAAAFMERYSRKRKRSWKEDQRIIDAYLLPRFKHTRAKDLKRADIRVMLDEIADGAPVQANRVLACVRKIYNWAISQDLADGNPCSGIDSPGVETPRQRVLQDAEIAAFWEAVQKERLPAQSYMKLLLLTMKREGETSAMRWDDIDLEGKVWTLPSDTTKPGLVDVVPLSSATVRVLKRLRRYAEQRAREQGREVSSWVFPGGRGSPQHVNDVQKIIQRVRRRSEIGHWTGHDLRRTARSSMGKLGVKPHISELLMGHKLPKIQATYDTYDYLPEKRDALEKWGKAVSRIVSGLREADLK